MWRHTLRQLLRFFVRPPCGAHKGKQVLHDVRKFALQDVNMICLQSQRLRLVAGEHRTLRCIIESDAYKASRGAIVRHIAIRCLKIKDAAKKPRQCSDCYTYATTDSLDTDVCFDSG